MTLFLLQNTKKKDILKASGVQNIDPYWPSLYGKKNIDIFKTVYISVPQKKFAVTWG